jgi:glycosyltransferase involved in cell wall biosynthesis
MIFIFAYELTSPGVKVIIENLASKLSCLAEEVLVSNNLEEINHADLIIPYGPKESYEIMKLGYPNVLSLLVDYYSLGCRNKIRFYLKHGKIFYKDFLYSIYGYLKYHLIEMKVASAYKHVALVSQNDINQLKKDAPKSNCVLIRNGVDHNRSIAPKTKDLDKIVLGIISNWQFVSIDETRWFIEGILPKITKVYPNAILRIAGRGDSEMANKVFSKYPNVEFVGPVDSLDDFFNNLDIYVATVPKGCGILNKVLDAFSYKVFTIGVKESFSGIDGLENGYKECKNANDYIKAIDLYLNDKNMVDQIVNNAYNHILKYHNFDNNYDEIVELIIALYKNASYEQ